MFIKRKTDGLILKYIQYFPVVCITGPRQSGKTTLIRKLFPDMLYFSFEDPDVQLGFKEDPKGFLKSLKTGAIFDEAQQVPEIFSYLQGIVDNPECIGKFVLSGSQNFLLLNKVTQTLAGRIGIIKLHPFSFAELADQKSISKDEYILKGFYPRIYNENIPSGHFYPNYIQTYIGRDIANIKTITDKTTFYRFIKLCAARCSQLLNYSQLAMDCGISVNTAKAWISLLESSYIIFLLPPYFVNISKQLVKSPKLYFYDAGLAAYLLGIKNKNQLRSHYMYGPLFENMVVADVIKIASYLEGNYSCFFLRDKTGHEIDLMIQYDRLICAEIKSGETYHPDYIKNLFYYSQMLKPDDLFLVYSGDIKSVINNVNIINWNQTENLFT